MRATHRVENQLYVRSRLARGLLALGFAVAFTGWLIDWMGHAQVANLVFITGWGIAAGSLAFLGAFEQLATLRLIQDLPTSRIKSAHQGYVELQGVVCDAPRYIACVQCGEPCLWYVCYLGKQKCVPHGPTPDIVLDDDTGHCLVKPAGAELYATDHYSDHVHIKAGDQLHVLGEFRSLSAGSPDATPEALAQKAALRKRLEALKRDPGRMALFDRDKDGTVDSREWDAAVKATKLQLAREPAPEPDWRPDHVVGKPTTEGDRLPFVIYVGTEEAAIARARREFIRRLVLAGLFAAVTIGIFLVMRSEAIK